MIDRGSEWHRWEPHIHAPGTILNNQFRAADPWDVYLTSLEGLTPKVEVVGRAVETLRMSGHEVADDTLRNVWPLAWDHLNLTGDYRWSADNPHSLENLRPLRLDRLPLAIAA